MTDEGPDVVGLSEAAEILGCRPRPEVVRARMEGVPVQEEGSSPIWAREAVERVAAGKTSRRKPPQVMGLKAVAEYLGIARPNVKKWCERRGLVPRQLASGPYWRKADIERGNAMTSARWK